MIRNIQPKMVDWLRGKLDGMGLFHDALKRKDARAIYLLANQACVGIREEGGNNRGPLVELMQRTLGGADREAWCMSAQQTCVAFAEEVTGVKSLLHASEHCMTVWRETPRIMRVQTIPLPGAMTIWKHGGSDAGHTGCTGTYTPKTRSFESFEGNTESGMANGKVERDGGGFYLTRRSVNGAGTMHLQGWLKPFPAA